MDVPGTGRDKKEFGTTRRWGSARKRKSLASRPGHALSAAAEARVAGEKIVYLGAGCFGVVEYKKGNDGGFIVKRRIHWEKEGEKQLWRKDLSSYITRI